MNRAAAFTIWFILNLLCIDANSQYSDTAAIKKEIIRGYDSSKKGNCNYTRLVAKNLIPVCTKIKNDNLLAGCYRLLATCYEKEAINDSSIFYYSLALKLYTRAKNPAMMGKMLVGIGIVFYNTGQYDTAITKYFDAIKVYEPAGDTLGMAWTYNNIGNIYFFQKAYDDALKHYLIANKLFQKKNYTDGLGVTFGNLALIYHEKKDTANAVSSYKKAIAMNRESDNEYAVANALCNLASLYFKQRHFGEAASLYDEALAINLHIKNYYGLSLTYVGMAALAAEKKDYKNAEKLLYKSLEANNTSDDVQSAIMTIENLSQLYFETGRYKDAYKLLLRRNKLSDSLNMGDKLAEVEARYGKEKREKEITLLKQEKEINELELKRRETVIYASVAVGILVLITSVFFIRNYNQKKKANFLLQEKNSEILNQKSIIEGKQKEVLDSIHYAKKIQQALIENEEMINRFFGQHFILFRPKDIVSGDFYFTAIKDNRFYLAVCDSTGHGVPGAFMSLLNSSFLNEAINEKQLKEPNSILNYCRERLINSISKDGSQDGMDAILFCFEFDPGNQLKRVTYSAANNQPLLVKNGSLQEMAADKMPVGKGVKEEPFKLYTAELSKGDLLYLYTDGFADQFGGPKGKKFKYKQLNDLLLSISSLSLNEQNEKLRHSFETWRGSLEQLDDVCIIGIKI